MKKTFIAILLVFVSVNSLCSQETTRAYLSTSAVIANPERGWYKHYDTNALEWYSSLDVDNLIQNREQSQVTLILRMFYLKDFIKETVVSSEYLEKMQGDFDAAREAGIKCIVRFAYSKSQNADKWDATPDKVLSHIESMSAVLSSNADVIAAVQAGFIGAWGEWYYTENFAGNGYNPSDADQENRRQLVEALLNVLPDHVSVQGRTPAIMKNIIQSEASISEAEAFSGSVKARIGHHNDCFLANSTDYGTYVNIDDDLAYLAQTAKYAIAGGETCDDSNIYSDCENALDRLATLHWTYLNSDYNQNVYSKWETQECYDEIDIALGYRLLLKSSTIDDTAVPGSQLKLSFSFSNVGYAAPTQYKPIQLVFSNIETAQKIVLDYEGDNNDVRYWQPGDFLLEGYVQVPDSMLEGNYTMSLQFVDQDSVLAQNPAYSIQLANAGVWNAVGGVNNLQHVVSVGNADLVLLPNGPELFAAQYLSGSKIELTWSANDQDSLVYEIMRSVKGKYCWELIAEVDSNKNTYYDTNISSGESYSYIIRSKNKYGVSGWSNIETTTSLDFYKQSSSELSYSIYPNPLFTGNLNIKFESETIRQITVFNMSGQLIYDKTMRCNEVSLNYSLFTSGIYHIRVLQDDIISTSKIIVY